MQRRVIVALLTVLTGAEAVSIVDNRPTGMLAFLNMQKLPTITDCSKNSLIAELSKLTIKDTKDGTIVIGIDSSESD